MTPDNDVKKLHPVLRNKMHSLHEQLASENITLKIKETYRSPAEQQALVNAGDSLKPWYSLFQYGLACTLDDAASSHQQRLKDMLAQDDTLELNGLSIHYVGKSIEQLLRGDYPDGGDDAWSSNLSKHIVDWDGSPKPLTPMPNLSGLSDGLSWDAPARPQESEDKAVD